MGWVWNAGMGLKCRAGLKSGLQPPAAVITGPSPMASDKTGLCITATDPHASTCLWTASFGYLRLYRCDRFFRPLSAGWVVCGWCCSTLVLFYLCIWVSHHSIVFLLWSSWCVAGCIPKAHLLEQLILIPGSGFVSSLGLFSVHPYFAVCSYFQFPGSRAVPCLLPF